METIKTELIQKMEAKGITVAKAAEAIELNAEILGLYLVNDSYPVPKRITDKLAALVSN